MRTILYDLRENFLTNSFHATALANGLIGTGRLEHWRTFLTSVLKKAEITNGST
jgi:hypothetical protein